MGGLTEWIPIAIALAIVLSAAVLLYLGLVARQPRQDTGSAATSNTFLLKGDRVIDHDLDMGALQGGPERLPETWQELRAWLRPGFENLPKTLAEVSPGASRTFPPKAKAGFLRLSISAVRNGRYRVTLADPQVPSVAERYETALRLRQCSLLEAATEIAECPTCVIGESGRITWSNKAFSGFTEEQEAQLMESLPAPGHPPLEPVEIADPDTGEIRFYEPSVTEARGGKIVQATDVTRIVHADSVRGAFIQTLTKTFADLATGLAVFDHSRRLVLFNPALIDLTGLAPEFLTAKPGLTEFFDTLRDRQVLPEPRSYSDWRAEITRMIESASQGQYSESWYLPNGLTYRLTGHPHPDGAVAFLIEDVTDQVAIERRYRAQIDTRQAVLDGLPEAIAVIGQNDSLAFTNRAFNRLLGYDPDSRFTDLKLKTVLDLCRERFPDPEFWEMVRARFDRPDERPRLHKRLKGDVACRVEPLPGRFTLLGLQELQSAAPEPV